MPQEGSYLNISYKTKSKTMKLIFMRMKIVKFIIISYSKGSIDSSVKSYGVSPTPL